MLYSSDVLDLFFSPFSGFNDEKNKLQLLE